MGSQGVVFMTSQPRPIFQTRACSLHDAARSMSRSRVRRLVRRHYSRPSSCPPQAYLYSKPVGMWMWRDSLRCMNKRCSRARPDSFSLVALSAVLWGCASGAHAKDACALDLQFIDARTFLTEQTVDGDAFGGISGIDYDARSN